MREPGEGGEPPAAGRATRPAASRSRRVRTQATRSRARARATRQPRGQSGEPRPTISRSRPAGARRRTRPARAPPRRPRRPRTGASRAAARATGGRHQRRATAASRPGQRPRTASNEAARAYDPAVERVQDSVAEPRASTAPVECGRRPVDGLAGALDRAARARRATRGSANVRRSRARNGRPRRVRCGNGRPTRPSPRTGARAEPRRRADREAGLHAHRAERASARASRAIGRSRSRSRRRPERSAGPQDEPRPPPETVTLGRLAASRRGRSIRPPVSRRTTPAPTARRGGCVRRRCSSTPTTASSTRSSTCSKPLLAAVIRIGHFLRPTLRRELEQQPHSTAILGRTDLEQRGAIQLVHREHELEVLEVPLGDAARALSARDRLRAAAAARCARTIGRLADVIGVRARRVDLHVELRRALGEQLAETRPPPSASGRCCPCRRTARAAPRAARARPCRTRARRPCELLASTSFIALRSAREPSSMPSNAREIFLGVDVWRRRLGRVRDDDPVSPSQSARSCSSFSISSSAHGGAALIALKPPARYA